MKQRKLIILLLLPIAFFFFYLIQSSDSLLKFYVVDEKGLHLNAIGTTASGEKWTLREYQPQDFEDHWRILEANKSDSNELKAYQDVSPASEESVRKRRERSCDRFAKGAPWEYMSLLNKDGKCILIFSLGRRTGREGPVRFGHGHFGLICDPAEAHHGYRLAMLKFLTQELAPEIKTIGESPEVEEDMRRNFNEDIDPKNEEGPYKKVGPLAYIDETCGLQQEDAWKPLLEVGFVFDKEGAVDWRNKTQILRSSNFKALEKDFLEHVEELKEKITEYQRYLIMGPKGQEIVVWNSPKWGGLKLCFIYEIPKNEE